ncbi:cobalamin-5'-phosphate synthase [Chthonomonas calidirosea]|uniref:adenosylcobinamide-GDP ribazoletransferase n=1 Tax=Chthonomonas calidirosea TaxID=454171 RepID=UPI0006DD3B2F|nr:adenosylcobinamide-GDP ribazoletransferase [Chthonomonas calidirosea]CEK14939.1 cobalamin-5'-phosphate synthase [Chthonomonas calidirosea]
MLRRELAYLGAAMMFLTRLPCARWARMHTEQMAPSLRYFPLVGLLIGVISAAAYKAALECRFSAPVGVLAAMGAAIVLTGAFHEDAFADWCDGFGAYTPEKRLEIMRDSRLGTFGVVGLFFLLAFKAALLASMPRSWVPWTLIVAPCVARWAVLATFYRSPYRAVPNSTVALFAGKVSGKELWIGTLLAATTGLIYGCVPIAGLLLGVGSTSRLLAAYFVRQLGGLSGDCLGVIVALSELLTMIALSHVRPFILHFL